MPLTPPLISALTAGILIVMQMALALTVALARRRNRQSLGDGGNKDVLQAARRHGNLAENAALFIAGFTLMELLGGDRVELEILCAVFVLARVSHAIGLSMPNTVKHGQSVSHHRHHRDHRGRGGARSHPRAHRSGVAKSACVWPAWND
jgi:uncharacterized membrane protein YecN with MAPEG domain